MNYSVGMTARPNRVRTAAFPEEAQLEAAIQALAADGYPEDLLGVAIRPGGIHLLTVLAPPGRERETDARLLDLGASLAAGVDEVPKQYGVAPHPGVREDHDMKVPMGREYPATSWAPAIAGYRVRPRMLDPHDRVWSFDEVECGYVESEAQAEAERCLNCPQPGCVEGCPAGNRIPDFIAALRRGDYAAGVDILRRTTSFPGICGRVCDKARQCEGSCVLGREGGDPVAIGMLERFLADWELQSGAPAQTPPPPGGGRRVAVVGAGPAGLAAAQQLALKGHPVTVFDALPVAGGVLAWGIPTFRLPQPVLAREIDSLRALGVEFRLNTRVGPGLPVEQLLGDGFEAVFIAVGATVPVTPSLEGEELEGVWTATEFLTRARLSRATQASTTAGPEVFQPRWQAPLIGERLVIIGAGNTAMDAAQTAVRLSAAEIQEMPTSYTAMDVAETGMRLGFREVTVCYRRGESEMPARREEIESAREEGVRFRFLTAPVRFIGDEAGRVRAMECAEMVLGPPDAFGRRNPVPKPGGEFVVEVDTVVLALGYQTDKALLRTTSGVTVGSTGKLSADPRTGRTGRSRVWAGGDVVSGPATVVQAMVAGRRAALDIDRFLRSPEGGAE